MDWLNLHTSILDSPEVLGADPIERATWLMLMRYCIGQENAGIIQNCRTWADRKWQQIVRVTLAETQLESQLWTWQGDDLHVTHYPLEKQREIEGKRRGGQAKTQQKTQAARNNGTKGGRPKTQQEPNRKPIEGKGRGIGKEREGEAERAGAPGNAAAANAAPLAEQLIQAHPRPSLARPALEAAIQCLKRHPARFAEILAATRTYAEAVAEWPADEQMAYCTTCAKWFNEDKWRDHPDEWRSRRAARVALAKPVNGRPVVDIGGRKARVILPGSTPASTIAIDEF